MPNQDWFRETFDRYAGELVSYARILLRDVDDLRSYAEDYVQMAFLQLCANQQAVREHERYRSLAEMRGQKPDCGRHAQVANAI